MTLTAAQFLSPLGDIEADTMFAGEDESVVRTRIETYIAEGALKVTALDPLVQDAAVNAWVYYRAYKAVFISLSATPSSNAMADQGSTLYTSAQIANFLDLSKEALKDFNNMIESGIITTRPLSYSVSHKVTYR